MKGIIIPALVGAFFSSMINAGQAKITGSAFVKRAPEFIKLDLTIKSECYGTPMMASAANNSAVIEAQEILERYIKEDSKIDDIYTNGGWVSPFSRTIYENGQRIDQCQGTYQQTTKVTFKTSDINGFSTTYAQIQEEVLATFLEGSEGEHEVTYLSISQPWANVCQETREEMALQASAKAVDDALAKFWAQAERLGISGDVEIAELGDEHYVGSGHKRSMAYNDLAPVPGGAAERVVNTNFEDIVEYGQTTLLFKFRNPIIKAKYDDDHYYYDEKDKPKS